MRRKPLCGNGLQLAKYFHGGYIFVMNTKPKKENPRIAEPIDAARLTALVNELDRLKATIQLARDVAINQENQALSIFYWDSAQKGIKSLNTFARAADESRRDTELGKPIEPYSLKPRVKLPTESAVIKDLNKRRATHAKLNNKKTTKKTDTKK